MKISAEYLAGLFDGEGYVGVINHRTQGSYYTLRATITNTEKISLQIIQSQFGGSLLVHEHHDEIHRDRWVLVWYGEKAKDLFRIMLPHSILKANQMRLALTFPIGKPAGRGIKVDKEKQNEIYVGLQKQKTWSRV